MYGLWVKIIINFTQVLVAYEVSSNKFLVGLNLTKISTKEILHLHKTSMYVIHCIWS